MTTIYAEQSFCCPFAAYYPSFASHNMYVSSIQLYGLAEPTHSLQHRRNMSSLLFQVDSFSVDNSGIEKDELKKF